MSASSLSVSSSSSLAHPSSTASFSVLLCPTSIRFGEATFPIPTELWPASLLHPSRVQHARRGNMRLPHSLRLSASLGHRRRGSFSRVPRLRQQLRLQKGALLMWCVGWRREDEREGSIRETYSADKIVFLLPPLSSFFPPRVHLVPHVTVSACRSHKLLIVMQSARLRIGFLTLTKR